VFANITDASEGLASVVGRQPDQYLRARDAYASVATSWPMRVGTAGFTVNTPAFSKTGWAGGAQAVVVCVGASDEYITLNHLAAARAADPDANMTFAIPYTRRLADAGVVLGFGNSTSALTGWWFEDLGNGTFRFYSRIDSGTVKDNITSTETLALNTASILVLSYGGGTVHITAHTDGVETVLISAATVALVAADFPLDTCTLNGIVRNGTTAPSTADYGGLAYWTGTRLPDSSHQALAAEYAKLYPL